MKGGIRGTVVFNIPPLTPFPPCRRFSINSLESLRIAGQSRQGFARAKGVASRGVFGKILAVLRRCFFRSVQGLEALSGDEVHARVPGVFGGVDTRAIDERILELAQLKVGERGEGERPQ